jgi:hypothetical protein
MIYVIYIFIVGASVALGALSLYPNINKQVNGLIALAPVTFMNYQASPLLTFLTTLHADIALKVLGNRAFELTPSIMHTLLGSACKEIPALCSNALTSLFGQSNSLNQSRYFLLFLELNFNLSL